MPAPLLKTILATTTLLCSMHGVASAADPGEIFAMPESVSPSGTTAALPAGTRLRIVLALNLRDQAGAEHFVHDASTPGSPNYGQYLSPKDFAVRFGATEEDYAALVLWAQAHGLEVGPQTASRTTLSVDGDVATLERLFATQLAGYRTSDGQPAYAPLLTPSLPAELAGHVVAVIGLASSRQYAPLVKRAALHGLRPLSAGGTGVGGAYSPQDFRTAYDIPAQPTAAPTETVAVFEQGGFVSGDIDTFARRYGLPQPPVTLRAVNGSGTGVTSADVEVEAVLDIDTILGVNPAVKQIIVYEDGVDPFPVALLDSLAAMADDDSARTISISYGEAEARIGQAAARAEHTILLQMAAQGQTVYASAGDNGAYLITKTNVTLSVDDPASQPQVTGVGGTTLFTGLRSIYRQEDAWNSLGAGGLGAATGGGVSTFWRIPDFQENLGTSLFLEAGGSTTHRNVPDVTADGDPNTGASLYSRANGGWSIAGGTSLSAPLWAGFSSILNATRTGVGLPRLGFFNPMIYTLGQSGFGIHDIEVGSNGDPNAFGQPGLAGYFAANGEDNVSGTGSFDGRQYLANLLEQDLSGNSGLPPSDIAAPAAAPATGSVTLTWDAARRATGYLVEVFPKAKPADVTFATTQELIVTVGGLAADTDYVAVVLPTNRHGQTGSPATRFTTTAR